VGLASIVAKVVEGPNHGEEELVFVFVFIGPTGGLGRVPIFVPLEKAEDNEAKSVLVGDAFGLSLVVVLEGLVDLAAEVEVD
jgi:hypothetical protein